jgi:hypothetical protein
MSPWPVASKPNSILRRSSVTCVELVQQNIARNCWVTKRRALGKPALKIRHAFAHSGLRRNCDHRTAVRKFMVSPTSAAVRSSSLFASASLYHPSKGRRKDSCGNAYHRPPSLARIVERTARSAPAQWRMTPTGASPITDAMPSLSIVFNASARAALSVRNASSHTVELPSRRQFRAASRLRHGRRFRSRRSFRHVSGARSATSEPALFHVAGTVSGVRPLEAVTS